MPHDFATALEISCTPVGTLLELLEDNRSRWQLVVGRAVTQTLAIVALVLSTDNSATIALSIVLMLCAAWTLMHRGQTGTKVGDDVLIFTPFNVLTGAPLWTRGVFPAAPAVTLLNAIAIFILVVVGANCRPYDAAWGCYNYAFDPHLSHSNGLCNFNVNGAQSRVCRGLLKAGYTCDSTLDNDILRPFRRPLQVAFHFFTAGLATFIGTMVRRL